MLDILIVIPARGGSKGIPRKNLRLLNGKPLIYYAINNALNSKFKPDVYVTSDDDEILHLAKKFGAKIHKREKKLASDRTTLDPVIFAAYNYAKQKENKDYDIIITLQPTSPLLKLSSLDSAIERIINDEKMDTIIAVKDSTQLSWRKEGNKYIPNYKKRVNRQYLTPVYTETGAFLITRKNIITENNRIGKNVDLYLLSKGEEIDIDTYEDWNICEYYLKRKHILFVVKGNQKVGLGHVYNTLIVANAILNHRITFLVERDSRLAYEKISSKNYPVCIQKCKDIIDDIKKIAPDIVINDKLDTSKKYIQSLKKMGLKVINFEDLGEGARYADLVINAIYPEKEIMANHYFGHKFFLLRDEFFYASKKVIANKVKKVLLTFGGVDSHNYTKKVLESIYDYCNDKNIQINVITGFGYNKYKSLERFKGINIYKDISNISDIMLDADLIFTSAGRTVFEVASIGTPAIVLAQNQRELTHFFASSEHGFLNCGLGYKLSNSYIRNKFIELVEAPDLRKQMNKLMIEYDLREGRDNVIKLLKKTIGD